MTIFIPDKIKVGYQNRSDTYTGKLAYVIYYNAKNQLAKQTSWDGWRNKDIDSSDYENSPISGFVLNKKVGDYKSDWNHRKAHIRVYDPRGFEFEISPENLLYILENTDSYKGKGLSGDFVYGWDKGDLILIPCDSPDFQELKVHSELLKNGKVSTKELVFGGEYITNDKQNLFYLGKFDYYTYNYSTKSHENRGKRFWFTKDGKSFLQFSSLAKFVKVQNTEPNENYAEWMDKVQFCAEFCPVDKEKTKFVKYSKEELNYYLEKGNSYWRRVWVKDENRQTFHLLEINRLDNGMFAGGFYSYWYNNSDEKTSSSFEVFIESMFFKMEQREYGYSTKRIEMVRGERKKFSFDELFELMSFYKKETYLKNGNLYLVE